MRQVGSSAIASASRLRFSPPGPAGFRLLGPLSVTDGYGVAVLPAGKPATLLAALLVRPNVLVSTERLKSVVWGDDTPASANTALHTCVRRLRRVLAGHGIPANSIMAVSGGYRIVADADTLDLIRFRQLAAAARTATDPDAELDLLRKALAEWQGPLLANVASDVLHRDEAPQLNEERLSANERAIDVELALGRCTHVLAELWSLTRTHPERERFWEQLIEALYRSGRQSEALAEYREVKGQLLDELGVDPGPALQRLELAILRGDDLQPATPRRPSVQVRPAPEREPATRLLPPPTAVPSFNGRRSESDEIVARLTGARTGPAIVVISGPPGIGKTALALHVAERVAEHFPGGRMAVRMTHPDGTSRTAQDIRAEIRGALPEASGARLLVLDDVVDVEAALSIVATGPSGAVVVTSRLGLGGLVARTHGSVVCRPGLFTPTESLAFLGAVLGADRVDAEPRAVQRLAAACDNFPLALRIAATRLVTRPLLRISDYVDWLEADLVPRLSLGVDDKLSVAAIFDLALARLDPELADAFVRLGAAAGPGDFAAADHGDVLAGWQSPEEPLERLADAGFLEEERAGQFHIYGLLRRFARSVRGRNDTTTMRAASAGGPVLALPRPRERADEYQAG